MNLEKMLELYREEMKLTPNEERVARTVRLSGEIFLEREQERMLNYAEFLKTQFFVLRKRWWLYQCLLLAAAYLVLGYMQEEVYAHRSVGVAGVLFVVLIIPEMWKNRTNCSMEVEAAAYYPLRQIYAARMLMFGVADFCIAAVFCAGLRGRLHFTMADLLVQFLFPMVVTACICFGILCNKYAVSEMVSVGACLVWSGVWWLIAMNEQIYRAVWLPAWACLFLAVVLLLAAVSYNAVKNCGKCLEVGLAAAGRE